MDNEVMDNELGTEVDRVADGFRSFEDLPVWQEAHKIVLAVYAATTQFPKEEQYGITSQMRRAALSIEANIAESFGRYHYADKINFLYNARGSVEELKSHLRTSKDLHFLNESDATSLRDSCEGVRIALNGVIAATRRQRII